MIQTIEILNIFITETGTQEDMVSRPWETKVNEQVIDIIAEKTHGGATLNPGMLSGLSGSLIQPSTNPDRILSIDGGWDVPRFRFNLIARYKTTSAARSFMIYSGYTSPSHFSPNTGFAPEMRLYFNSVITLMELPHIDKVTGVRTSTWTVQHNNQLMHPTTMGGGLDSTFDLTNFGASTIPSYMRPQDLMMSLASQNRSQFGANELDFTTSVLPAKNSRQNNSPATYLARSLDSVITAISNPTGEHDQLHATYDNGAGLYGEAMYTNDPLIFKLTMGTSNRFNETGYVEWSTLGRIFPELFGNDKIVRYTDNKKIRDDNFVSQRGRYNPWVASAGAAVPCGQAISNNPQALGGLRINTSNEAIIATACANGIPELLSKHLIGRAHIVITNMKPGSFGTWTVEMDSVRTLHPVIPGESMRAMVPHACKQIDMLIARDLPGMDSSNSIPVFIDIFCDVSGDMIVSVGYNGGVPEPFSFPLFTDSKFPPIVAQSQPHLNGVANDVNYLGSSLIQRNVPGMNGGAGVEFDWSQQGGGQGGGNQGNGGWSW